VLSADDDSVHDVEMLSIFEMLDIAGWSEY